jgi:molecular chaperone DnaK
MISDKLAARTPAVTECSTPPEYHKIVGIDLGTNFSVIAAWNNVTAGAEAFDVPGHQPPTCSLPSVVSLNRQGKTLVGWQAKRNLAANPGNTIMEVKRLMGDPQELDLGGRKFSPQMISAMVLEQLKAIAETRMGSPIHDAVIAVPAHFTNVQRQATSDVARLAGVNPRLLINEPTAVAFAFGLDHLNDEEETYVVYDLGGSTFDASVIVARDKGIEVIASAGDDRLGGDEFDNVIAQWVLEHLEQEWPGVSVLVHQHKDLWARLKAAAEQAKIDLSTADTATIDVPNLTPKIDVLYEINRDTFIRLLDIPRARRPGLAPVGLLGFTILAVEEAVARAGARLAGEFGRASFGVEDVAAFVLVGGSVRIPRIREMLAERFGRPVLFDSATADTAVAVGAAIVARLMTPMGRFEG